MHGGAAELSVPQQRFRIQMHENPVAVRASLQVDGTLCALSLSRALMIPCALRHWGDSL